MNLSKLQTEQQNPRTLNLDTMSSLEIAKLMNQEDRVIIQAIENQLEQIAKVIDLAVQAFENGGRLIYIGAGTSGRLGVLDASECVPTFGVDENMVVGIIAGGDIALRNAVENAEDNEELAVKDLQAIQLNEKDVLVGIAASGRTPYVKAGLQYAHSVNASTGSICNNKGGVISQYADVAIELETGPEVLCGSTRLKSGTSQKMVLNMISTGAMVQMGKAYDNLMIDVRTSNEKLRRRAENIVKKVTNAQDEDIKKALEQTNGKVKPAVVMIVKQCDEQRALQYLEQTKGHLKQALEL